MARIVSSHRENLLSRGCVGPVKINAQPVLVIGLCIVPCFMAHIVLPRWGVRLTGVKLWEQHFLGFAVAHLHDVHPALRPVVATTVDGVVAHDGGFFLIGRSHSDSPMWFFVEEDDFVELQSVISLAPPMGKAHILCAFGQIKFFCKPLLAFSDCPL